MNVFYKNKFLMKNKNMYIVIFNFILLRFLKCKNVKL